MTWNPDQHDDHAIVRLEGHPNEAHRPAEKTRMKRFLEFMHIKLRKAGMLGEAYADAEVAKKQNEAAKVAAEAAAIAARRDLDRIKVVKAVNDEIERIFANEELSPEVAMMQFGALVNEHPEILEQREKINQMIERLHLQRSARIEIVQEQSAAIEPRSED